MDTPRNASSKSEAPEPNRTLSELRDHIDRIDRAMLENLTTRFRLAEEVGSLKAEEDLPALDPLREAHIVRKASEAARERGIPDEGVRQIFWTVIDYCRDGVQGRLRAAGTGSSDGCGGARG